MGRRIFSAMGRDKANMSWSNVIGMAALCYEAASSTLHTRMRVVAVSLVLLAMLAPRPARAQEPPPRIPPFVLDLHATVPRFPDDPLLGASRGLVLAELPGSGLGVQVGIHVYPIRWRAVTFGIGGEVTTGRSRETPADGSQNI